MRFITAGMGCPIREQACLRGDHGSGVRRYGRRHAFSRLKRFGQRLGHGVIPSGRLLNQLSRSSSGRHPPPMTSFYPRLCDARGSVMPLGVERSSQSNALPPPNSFLLWQILPAASGNGLICRENPIKGSMIVFMEIISNLYSHAQPQFGSTQSVRRSG